LSRVALVRTMARLIWSLPMPCLDDSVKEI
jgi:hypothetical protein